MSTDILFHDGRAQAIALMRRWIITQFQQGKSFRQVDTGLRSAMGAIIQEYYVEWDVPGVRYWEHPESDAFIATGPGENITDYMATVCVELDRDQFLERQGLAFGYKDTL